MAKELNMLNKSLQENLDLTAYSQVGHTHKYAGSSTAGGAATSATKLASARKINGTSFDGTGDITTANWGTARNIQIGSTSKSVNGSGNVGWTLAEIGAAASSHSHDTLSIKGTDTITSTTNDTTAKWGAQGISVHWYTKTGQLTDQPGQWGYLLNIGSGSEVHQLWMTQASGDLKHRGGNGDGWSGTWRTILDTSNYKTHVTPDNIGAAAASHGTHVTYASATPAANGTADVGSSAKVAREDHVHPLQTTISGTAGSAGKWTTARTLTIGNAGKSVDGSANVSWTLSEIGALPLSGGTLTGKITTPNNAQGITIGDDATICDRNIADHIVIEGSTATNGGITFGSGKDTNIYRGGANILKTDDTFNAVNGFQWNGQSLDNRYAKASHGSHISFSTATPKVAGTAAIGSDSGAARGDHVHPAQTSVSGNAGTATKLQTARNINGTAFDGTANITTAQWGNARNIYIADSNGTNTGAAVSVNGSANATLKLPATIKATLSGNASTATKLAAARTINGTNFDGSANITTANWGTSRKINQISVNGSADVKIPLDYYTCNIGASNSKLYHHILTTGQCTGSWTDKSITIVITQHYNGGGLGIARATFRTNDAANGATASGELKWLVRLGFNEDQLCYNLRNTAKDAYMDVFFKCNGTYGSTTWYVLTEGVRGDHSSQWTKYNTHHDNGTHVYNETGMKTIRTYTSTLVAAEDAGFAERSNNAYYADDAGTATKLATARTITIGNKANSFNGSANISYTLADIGAAAAGHTHNYAGSGSAGGTANSAARLDMDRVAGSGNSANYVPGANRLVVREYGNDCTNMPSAHWYHIYTGQGSDPGYNTQLAVGMTTEALCFRNKNANTWGSWKKVSLDGHTHSNYATTTTTGSLSSLKTSAKGNLVAAINELFQNANNGKQLIASAIGTPLSNSDTFSAMSDKINSLLNTFKTNMMINGVSVGSEDKFKSLIDKIATLADNEDKGLRYAEGTFEDFTLWLTTSGSYVDVPYELDFTPTLLFVKFNYINNTKGTTLSNPYISNKGYTNFYMNYGLLVGIENISSNGFQIFASYGGNSDVTFKGVTWYAIGVGEESNGGLDIISAASLPVTGKEDQICVITNNPTNNFLITTDFNDTQSTSAICIYLGDAEDVLPSSKLTITKGNITNIYYFNRVCQQNKRLSSYHYANNQWNLLTKANIPVYENGSFPSEDILGVSPVKNSNNTVFLDGNEIFFGTDSSSLRGFTFPKKIDFSSYHKVTIVARLVSGYTVGYLNVASMKEHYTSIADIWTNTLNSNYAYNWVQKYVSSETGQVLTYDISSFTGSGYLGIVAGGTRSNFYIQEIILE